MTGSCDFSIETAADGATTLALSGAMLVGTVGPVDRALRAAQVACDRVDIAAVGDIDTVGAWVVWRLARDAGATITGASDHAARLIAAVRGCDSDAPIVPILPGVWTRVPATIGQVVVELAVGMVGTVAFFGAMLVSVWGVVGHPRRIRMTALVRQMELVGVDALAIVGLMSFLVGIVIAQQGAVQLQQFGAQIYTVNLTGRLALRELGILMTAIMVAGRSGSAFAAQIGTMKLTEEIDAMRTIGVSPMEALVLPRVVATVLMMPLLGCYAALFAILGGATISAFTLDIPFWNFLARVQEVVPLSDLWVGLVKGPVFGLIVAMTGCYQGMQVSGNSEDVGLRTTLAVVQAIFMVIVLDAFFAVFFTKVGWV